MTTLTTCPYCHRALPEGTEVCLACGAPLSTASAIDPRLLCNGEFRLLRRLDNGASATLYLAEQARGGDLCVVKELPPPAEWKARPLFEAMVQEEAHLLHRLSKESLAVPRYYDSFIDSGVFYIVLEFVPGQNLARYMYSRDELLPIAEVLTYSRQVLDVLVAIHHLEPAPVIHGDIKPSNLIRRPDGQIVVLDFGVAQTTPSPAGYVPGRASVFGTPGYTPPEQWEGHPTPASDIFALGATLHQLLTGRDPAAPFARLSQVSLADLSALTSFPSLTLVRPDAPLALDTLLTHMLNRRASARPTAAEVRSRLTAIEVSGLS
jgi:serine/threonine protein kinase